MCVQGSFKNRIGPPSQVPGRKAGGGGGQVCLLSSVLLPGAQNENLA